MPRAMLILAGLSIALAGAALAFGLLPVSSPRPRSDSLAEALDRPEVRAPACPSNGAMQWNFNRWTMTIGPAQINFAYGSVGPNKEVFAYAAATDRTGTRHPGALYQKLPLIIDAPPGTPFTVSGANYYTGEPMAWDGPVQLWADAPVSERKFAPGQMIFPGPGCYQVWIEVEGQRYGPFGFVVRSGNSGEIVSRPH